MILTPLSDIPAHARVWIYQADRQLSELEKNEIEAHLQDFTIQWTSHNNSLKAFGRVLLHRFLLLAVDEGQANASGCSIDKSVQFIKQLEQHFRLSLFDRLTFAYLDKETLKTATKDDFTLLYRTGKINDKTLVFNNLVQTKLEMEQKWLLPLNESWHKNFV